MPTKFTQNWFEVTGKENFETYVKNLHGKFLEIGCFEGMATKWMLDNTDSDITVIDTFEGSEEHKDIDLTDLRKKFEENIDHSPRVTIIQGESGSVLKTLDNKFDFIYVDGSHNTSDVLQDAVLSFPLLKTNGIIIFDDYGWYGGLTQDPRLAIDSFISCHLKQMEVIVKNNQCIIRKV